MINISYDDIVSKVRNYISEIFSDVDYTSLTKREIRRKIYDFYCDRLKYDYISLEKLYLDRDFPNQKEMFLSVLNDKNPCGVCNAISQLYTLTLEEFDIKSYSVWCNDGTEVTHNINMVYDEESDSYSFDDITGVIVGRGTKDDFFSYDRDRALLLGQGDGVSLLDGADFYVASSGILEWVVDHPSNLKSYNPLIEDRKVDVNLKCLGSSMKR